MRNVTLFIAMSLDGYIADENGGVAWLAGQEPDAEMPDTYSEFVQGVDTVLMGWNTYHQVVAELSPDAWPYEELMTYVLTHRTCDAREGVCFTSEDPASLVRSLRAESGKGIWVCGGANLLRQLMCEDLIDAYYITVVPTLLGGGIRLFGEVPGERRLRLVKTQSYNGMVDMVYEREMQSGAVSA